MSSAYYRPRQRYQLTGSSLQSSNCGPASAADLADRYSLGAIDLTPDEMRKLTGDRVGGTTIRQLAEALEKVHVPLVVFDYRDGMDADRFRALVKSGVGAIANMDYSKVPEKLEADKDFEELHSMYADRWRADAPLFDGTRGPGYLVFDPLADGRRPGIPLGPDWWPERALHRCLADFPGPGWTVGTWQKRTLRKRRWLDAELLVRARATRESEVVGRLGSQTVQHGGVELGEPIADDPRWWRIWLARANRVGYVHDSDVLVIRN